jgi:hypothetical protein
MIREIDPRKPAFGYLKMSKNRMKKIIEIVKKSNFLITFDKSGPFPILISKYIGEINYNDLVEVIRDEFGRDYISRRYAPVRLFYIIDYFVWASIIYLKGAKDLRTILHELSIAKNTLGWTRKTLFGKNYLKYLTQSDNYLEIVPIVKILSEYMDLPLKGKSLEEYRQEIIETCKELINDEK